MRFACLLPALLLTTGCAPDVTFVIDGGSRDATRDSPHPLDAADDGASGDAEADASDAGDAAPDASDYCKGDAGAPNTAYKCCGSSGTVCAGPCTPNDCLSCQPCPWPQVCCTGGGQAKCLAPGSC